MAYDEGQAQRVRELLQHQHGITEKKMFGGIAVMSHGHMAVGLVGAALMARVGPAHYTAALERPHVRQMDFTGKPMKGYVFVDPQGLEDDAELAGWVAQCLAFVGGLPDKGP